MSIALLPQEAARAIGSTSALYDSCSVIKELVDNALDAEATSISIEISENTLDTVVVKDNGTGISAEGRDLVCRPNCTSKLQDVGDLRGVGAHSLGFRGLAMSSIAETCEVVTITTRTRQEAVGAVLSFRRDGTLIGEDKIAHPVGTTVRLKGFLTRLPVRRQVMLKRASSTIVRITELVKAYSLARLSIRFSLRVMNKSSSPWTYAPKSPCTHADAVLNVCGKDIASQCQCISWPEQVSEDGASARLIALLPRIDADIKKATGSQYISVDGRPLASNRGIAKALIKSFKTHLRGARQREGLVIPSGKQFICIYMSNPPSDYDANVEPAKDDLVFSDETAVLALAEEAFRQFYGQPADACTSDLNSKQQMARPAIDDDSSITKCVATPFRQPNGRRCNVAPRQGTQNFGIAQQASLSSMMAPSKIMRSAVPACDSPERLASRDQGPHQLERDSLRRKHLGQKDMPGSSPADCILVRGRSPARATSAKVTGAIDQWLQHKRHMPREDHAGPTIDSPMDEMDLANHLLSQRFDSVGAPHDEQAQLHGSRPLVTSESPGSLLNEENQRRGVTSLQIQSCPIVSRQRGTALNNQYGKSVSLPSSTPRGGKTCERETVAISPLAALPTPSITPGKLRQSELNEWYGARQTIGSGVPRTVTPRQSPARDEDDDEYGTIGLAIKISDSEKEIAFRFSISRKTDGYSASCAHMSDITSQLDSTGALRYWSSRLSSFMKESYCFDNAVSGESCSPLDVIQKFIRDQKAR